MGGVLRRLLPLFAAVFGLGIGLVTLDVTEAAAPKLIAFTAPQPTQGSPLVVSWRLREVKGAETWVAWDTRASSAGAPRNATKHLTGKNAIETFSDTIQVPSNATTLYFTVVIKTNGSTLQFSERKVTVIKRLAAATSVDEAEDAMALVEVEDTWGYTASGSAFVIDRDTLLTNQHVIDGAETITVIFGDGSRRTGTVVGYDVLRDVAVIRATTPSNAKRLEWNGSRRTSVGTKVWAWGYPGSTVSLFGDGVRPTLTDGIVSQYQTTDGVTYIQTNADVHPGNSGGPLVTADGKAIGIVSAGLINPWTGASESGLNLALSLADHIPAVNAVIAGKNETGEKFAPAGVSLSGMRFVPTDGPSCDDASPDNYPGIVGLCLVANYPDALDGVSVDIVWKQDGAVVCDTHTVITSSFVSGMYLFSCDPPRMITAAYSVTLTSGTRVIGTLSRQVTVAAVDSTTAAVDQYVQAVDDTWGDHIDVLTVYTYMWNSLIDTESLPSPRLNSIAMIEIETSRDMLSWLQGMSSHPALSDPTVNQMHVAAVQAWNAMVNYYVALGDYSQLATSFNTVDAKWDALDQALTVYQANRCNVMRTHNLGAC